MGDGPDAANGSFTAAIGGSPDVCRRLNLVATVCKQDTGMARMAGCLPNYHPMCSTKGSVVKRCTEYPGFAQLPTTKAVNDAVKQLCTAKRSRPGCAACLPSFDAAKTYGSCDLLGTWGGICAAEPKLPQCANHTALCAKDKAWYFCKAGATAITDKGWKLLNATLTAAATTAAGPKAAAHDMSGHDMAGHDHDMAGHDMAGHDHDHDMAGHNKTAPRGLYESPASANTTKPKAASRAACAVAAPLLGLALAVAAALV
ncbi:Protein P80 [Monoraphidium neglectum]|uniref:Protein P80 n=1 Tax=Monoraphidium neglectum TaxID=145388 RepID=A0A0D2NSC3_9CHLO|nr:Protein P80 [Monoraphidium neglectum]KIZ07151.1 Protein P80 [Monoraphidium neglectum]|eukprot:XP_013906170.1 Protein P80 [Monoraphidium neglectum]